VCSLFFPIVAFCRALLHFLDPVKFNSKDTFVERYKNLSSFNETEVLLLCDGFVLACIVFTIMYTS
jgi:hypothetical protein